MACVASTLIVIIALAAAACKPIGVGSVSDSFLSADPGKGRSVRQPRFLPWDGMSGFGGTCASSPLETVPAPRALRTGPGDSNLGREKTACVQPLVFCCFVLFFPPP